MATAGTLRETIESWLVSDDVVRRDNGGVVSFLALDGSWNGLYPEICGYHLQFLASAGAARHHEVAQRVIAFVAAVSANGRPPTLVRSHPFADDWRNACLFSFDLAMLIRGLDAVGRRWPDLRRTDLVHALIGSLLGIVEGGRLASHLVREGQEALHIPAKWSTRPGVHHVKAAAAVIDVGDAAAGRVALATLVAESAEFDRAGTARLRELHPFLYFVEGWLIVWGRTGTPAYLDAAARAFHMVTSRIDPESGALPPAVDAPGAPVRSDVVAQALRAGVVLERAGRSGENWPRSRDALSAMLSSHVQADGSVLFDVVGRHRNTWAALFAWQALDFLDRQVRGELDARSAAAALI